MQAHFPPVANELSNPRMASFDTTQNLRKGKALYCVTRLKQFLMVDSSNPKNQNSTHKIRGVPSVLTKTVIIYIEI